MSRLPTQPPHLPVLTRPMLQDPDVVCLQEVNYSFEKVLHATAGARSKWLVTQLRDEQPITQSHYGTIFLIRKSLTVGGCTASVSFTPYEGTRCGRGLSLLEIILPQGDVVSLFSLALIGITVDQNAQSMLKILIGNTHLEYNVEERAAQMQYCVEALSRSSSQKVPAVSVLCGDTNILAYSEIDTNFVSAGFVDALVAANPPQASNGEIGIDLFDYLPTHGRAGIKFKNTASKERIGRLDYILCRPKQDADGISRFRVTNAGLLGASPILHEIVKKEGRVDDPDMDVYPSDHLGVYVDIKGF